MGVVTSQEIISLPTSTTAAPTHSQGHEVQQVCPMAGCTYTSYPTSDPNMLSACVNQITMHMKYANDVSMSESGGGGAGNNNINPQPDMSYREYKEATKQRTVKKVIDDASRNLCEACYFAVSLDNKVLAQNMPVATSPVNTLVDFSHLGVDVSSKETTKSCTTEPRPTPGSGTSGTPTSRVSTPQETRWCVKAAYNYAAMHGQFHPMDWSPKALLKTMLDKMFEGPATVDQYVRLFERFISEKGGRA